MMKVEEEDKEVNNSQEKEKTVQREILNITEMKINEEHHHAEVEDISNRAEVEADKDVLKENKMQ